jgi:hypothetical protein
MQTRQLRRTLIVMIAVAIVASAAWHFQRTILAAFSPSTRVDARVGAVGAPVVMRTAGGLLEVATLAVDEHFTRRDSKALWGVPLGETVSEIRVPVTYRFHIELAREWPVEIEGTRATVKAPALAPSLPVAFDTGAMRKSTVNGWARFNASENLAAVERSMSVELAARAGLPQYRALVREEARRTVAEFVAKWLLTEQRWQRGPGHSVAVVFADDPPGPAADPIEALQ